jgi:hypothetical protein
VKFHFNSVYFILFSYMLELWIWSWFRLS